MINIDDIKNDFPILKQMIHGYPLVYLDNAATTQKPQIVLDKLVEFYASKNSNIHRGVHYLSEQASATYEAARETVKSFINAEQLSEVVFTQGTTDSINLVADTFGRQFIKQNDEIIITTMEHHSNFVPWQMLCERNGAILKVIPVDDNGILLSDKLESLITNKTKLISLTHVSNVMGIINPVKDIIGIAHAHDIPVLIDGAQAVQHFPVNVQDLDCDFYTFSGHKIYAETGIGVLYGKQKWLDKMLPVRFGGGMVDTVTIEKTSFGESPLKFEAGTSNFVGAMSLATAIEYLNEKGFDKIVAHENRLFDYTLEKFNTLEDITIYGDNADRCGAIAFNLNNIHPYDAGSILDKMGIAVRTGTHCAEPLMKHFNVSGSIRASFALYNTCEDVDKLIDGIKKVQKMMQ